MKFLTRIEQEAKELEINGFLHNSRGTNKIDSTSSNTQQEQIPVIDFAHPELLEEKSTEDLTTLYQNLNTRRSASDREYELLVKIHSILTERKQIEKSLQTRIIQYNYGGLSPIRIPSSIPTSYPFDSSEVNSTSSESSTCGVDSPD